jgi:streptogramin lyase
VLAAAVAASLALAAPAPPLEGAAATSICARTGIPYPQTALARGPSGLWLACRERGTIVRYDAATGKVRATLRLRGVRPWAIASGLGFVWAVDRDTPSLLRIDPHTRRQRRIPLDGLPVALWVGGGAVWVGLEQGKQVARVAPTTGKVRLVQAGDGASGFASDGRSVWIACHRDNSIVRVDLATGNVSTTTAQLSEPANTAAERIAYAAGSLWVTGRGLDLLRVDPQSGQVVATIEIGAAGIEILPAGAGLLVAAATAAGARRGDPVVGALALVDPATNSVVSRVEAHGRVLLSGLAVAGERFWLADTVGGRLLRGAAR